MHCRQLLRGAAVRVSGKLVPSPMPEQPVELLADQVKVFGSPLKEVCWNTYFIWILMTELYNSRYHFQCLVLAPCPLKLKDKM